MGPAMNGGSCGSLFVKSSNLLKYYPPPIPVLLGTVTSSPEGERFPLGNSHGSIKLDAKTAPGHLCLHSLLNQQGVKGGPVKPTVIDQSLAERSSFQYSSWPNCPSAVLILLVSSCVEFFSFNRRLPSWANAGHKCFTALNRC